jgi:hypothetical protein
MAGDSSDRQDQPTMRAAHRAMNAYHARHPVNDAGDHAPDQTTVSDTTAPPRLLAPDGAEPGSWWLACSPDRSRALRWQWTGTHWCWPNAYYQTSPALAAASDWTLDDPHGLAAAVRLLEVAGLTMPTLAQERAGHWHVATSHGSRSFFGTGASALAAAQAALAEWRRETRDA